MGAAKQRGAYHHGDLRSALITAALEQIETEGAAGLGLRAAARAAGVSQTAPYHHFDGKEGLLAAVAAHGFRVLQAAQMATRERCQAEGLEPAEIVRELGIGYVQSARRHPELFKLMFGTTLEDRSAYPELVEAYAAAYDVIRGAVAAALEQRDGEVDAATLSVAVSSAWSTVHGLAILLIDGRLRPGEGDMPVEDELVRQVLGRFSLALTQPVE